MVKAFTWYEVSWLIMDIGHKEKRCPHLPPPEDQVRLIDLRDQILVSLWLSNFNGTYSCSAGISKRYRGSRHCWEKCSDMPVLWLS